MTTEQNKAWLKELKMVDKEQQLSLIQNRFFRQKTFEKSDNDDIPVLVVDGIPISEQMDSNLRDFLAYQLSAEKIQIEVLDKEPEQLHVNKRWTGLILLNITDKKTRKKMYKWETNTNSQQKR
ncbi:MAG: hypothetical protein JNL17_15980 [Cyclobacteriaceae bacterium]|nr:hypothetical protein [Cyclobacteriaceae bacterium]